MLSIIDENNINSHQLKVQYMLIIVRNGAISTSKQHELMLIIATIYRQNSANYCIMLDLHHMHAYFTTHDQ
jgi:anti-anti-sigma regulatory factor